jgi:hypothetical protein
VGSFLLYAGGMSLGIWAADDEAMMCCDMFLRWERTEERRRKEAKRKRKVWMLVVSLFSCASVPAALVHDAY